MLSLLTYTRTYWIRNEHTHIHIYNYVYGQDREREREERENEGKKNERMMLLEAFIEVYSLF